MGHEGHKESEGHKDEGADTFVSLAIFVTFVSFVFLGALRAYSAASRVTVTPWALPSAWPVMRRGAIWPTTASPS